mgnify:CR=1 FL=1
MSFVADEIANAKRLLGLSDTVLGRLSLDDGNAIIAEAESRFVLSQGIIWWWEDLRPPSLSRYCPDGDGWRKLVDLAPCGRSPVWFIAAADDWPVYESTVGIVQRILGECNGFEFYIVSHDYEWLMGENHHNFLFVSGEPAATNLANW